MSRHGILDPSYPHELFQVQIEAVRQLIDNISEFPDSSELRKGDNRYLVNYVSALLGQRGAGKTTVMLELRKQLFEESKTRRWLCTEILVPDVLHSRDAIGPAIFDLVRGALLAANQADEAQAHKIDETLDPIKSNLAWFYNPFVPNDIIARDSISATDFARSVFNYHVDSKNLHRQYSAAIEDCLGILGYDKVIVLIDDADINLDLVGRVLDVIRYALSSPRIVTVFSCDYSTLRRRLFNERLLALNTDKLPNSEKGFFGTSGEEYKAREIEAERDYVDAYLTKLLPPSTRVMIPSLPAEELVRRRVRLGGSEAELTTIGELLDTITLPDSISGKNVCLSSLVERYPSVLETNLRAFINQASQISEIVKRYRERDLDFFEISQDADEQVPIVSQLLEISSALSPIDEAVLVRVLRVLLSSGTHSDWFETLYYYGIIDVTRESSLSKLVEIIVTRADVVGSAIDYMLFSTSTGERGLESSLTRKEQVHIIHLIMDIAICLGTKMDTLYRLISNDYSEAFRSIYLSSDMLEYMERPDACFNRNINLVKGSSVAGISGLVSGRSNQYTAPIFVLNSRDIARHMHYSMRVRTFERVTDANKTLRDTMRDEDSDEATKLAAEVNHFYRILFFMMELCVDQVRSAVGILFDLPTSALPAPELAFTSNVMVNWGIVTPIAGWRFLRGLLSNSESDGSSRWDKPLIGLFQLAQLPYQAFFACFDTNGSAPADREMARQLAAELKADLEGRGIINASGRWQPEAEFRASVAEATDLPFLKRSMALWPTVLMSDRGAALLEFIDFMAQDGIDLPAETDLRSAPPPAWTEWIDRFAAIEKARAVDSAAEGVQEESS